MNAAGLLGVVYSLLGTGLESLGSMTGELLFEPVSGGLDLFLSVGELTIFGTGIGLATLGTGLESLGAGSGLELLPSDGELKIIGTVTGLPLFGTGLDSLGTVTGLSHFLTVSGVRLMDTGLKLLGPGLFGLMSEGLGILAPTLETTGLGLLAETSGLIDSFGVHV